ncbi:MAG: hypothetical protein KDD44_00520 [Bdellovibrionales bacterium]|nr:hypothetical protein [Bdellovibrionales bacterium]
MKILVFTTDMPPLPGLPTSGTALRTWGLAQGLAAHGHSVELSPPKSAHEGLVRNCDRESLSPRLRAEIDELGSRAFDAGNQADIIASVRPDIILCGHWPALSLRTKPKQPVVVDLAGPHLLERHYQRMENQQGAIIAKLGVVATADYYIVSGPSQRLYFLSFLMRAGIRDAASRIAQITMPLDPRLPTPHPVPEEFPRFVFGGVFLPWQDPSAALRHLSEDLSKRDRGSLTLIGGKHPNYAIDEGPYAALFSELAKNPRVSVNPMQPYEQFVQMLTSSDVALDLMAWNLERELALTIRSTTYLWSGVPVIYNDYADLGRLITHYDAGWTVSPSDKNALSMVLDEIFSSPEVVRRKSAHAQQLARDIFAWDRAVQPLLELLNSPVAPRSHESDIIVDCPESADFLVSSGAPMDQYFVSRIPGLARVECKVTTHDAPARSAIRLRLFQVERADARRGRVGLHSLRETPIAEQVIEPELVRNNEWLALEVPKQPDSAGRTYRLRLESVSPNAGDRVGAWTTHASPYPLLSFYHGEQFIEQGGMCLRTTCSVTAAEIDAA